MRDFAVPSGIPSSSATCRYVRPPKYANSIASRCSVGSRSTSARTCSAVTIAIASSPTSGIGHRGRGVARGAPAARLLAAHDIDGAAVRERAEERPQATARGLERLRPLPDRHEHLLGHVLGGVAIADHPRPRARTRTSRTGRRDRRAPTGPGPRGGPAPPAPTPPLAGVAPSESHPSGRCSPSARRIIRITVVSLAEPDQSLTTRGNACRICSTSRARPRS